MHAFAVALLMMACTPPPSDDADVRPGAEPAARPAAQDSAIRARVGEAFVITLQANATTGYRWMLADSLDAGMLRLESQAYLADPPAPGQPPAVGGGGHERFTFTALAAGETTIRLRYARHGQSSGPRTAAFRVVIHPAGP